MKKIVLLISLLLAVLPFFWFSIGDINIGGDSSRLYFYDPMRYLKHFAFYSIVPSEIGSENIPYSLIPFTVSLALVKLIVRSPYVLIVLFYAMMMTVSFLSIYGIAVELLKRYKNIPLWTVQLSGIVSGIFYLFNPIIGPNWDKNLYSHNQVFLNPLLFYLALKYFNTKNTLFGIVAALVTFIFAPNFTFASAPSFFAFYPLAVMFLVLYGFLINKSLPSIKSFGVVVGIALLIHSFHIIPLVSNLFDTSTSMFSRVFEEESAQEGLSYFDSARRYMRLSRNLAPIPQNDSSMSFYFLSYLIIGIVIAALVYNKKQTSHHQKLSYLLLIIFFLGTMFLETANITPLITNAYRALFLLPGFSMFRNFYGQFMYVYYFYFALVFGFGLSIVLSQFSRKKQLLISISLLLIISINSWNFINGNFVNLPFYNGKKNVDGTFKMDPDFNKVIEYFEADPVEGKVLVLPLTDFGYQVLAGDGGYYMGPSIIGYLSGKKDFAGYPGLAAYSDEFVNFAKNRDYDGLKSLLSMFNIRYIIHNTDEQIYDKEYFTSFPYDSVRKFLPDTQKDYKDFIAHLGAVEKKRFSEKYILYEIPQPYYLPHFYVTSDITYLNEENLFFSSSLNFLESESRPAFIYEAQIQQLNADFIDNVVISALNKSPYLDLVKQREGSRYPTPFVSHIPSSVVYPFIIMKEKQELEKLKKEGNFDEYYDTVVFFAEKRLVELERWKDEYRVLGVNGTFEALESQWQETPLSRSIFNNNYLNWEVGLIRYYRLLDGLINEIESTSESQYPQVVNKLTLYPKLIHHQNTLIHLINSSTLPYEQKIYVRNLTTAAYSSLFKKIAVTIPQVTSLQYEANPAKAGTYEVYVERKSIQNYNLQDVVLKINDSIHLPSLEQDQSQWVQYDSIDITSKDKLSFDLSFLAQVDINDFSSSWKSPEKISSSNDASSLEVVKTNPLSGGVVKEIPRWNRDSVYVLSFEYNTHNNPFMLSLYEQKSETEDKYKKVFYNKIFEKNLIANKWSTIRQLIPPSDNVETRLLHLTKGDTVVQSSSQEEQQNKVNIRNLSIIQIPHPRIILKYVKPERVRETPSIAFTKINPTKYLIDIKNAFSSYTLVMQDSYSPRWKLYLDPKLHPQQRRFPYNFLNQFTNLFARTTPTDKTTAVQEKYFDGSVIEKAPANTPLSGEIFDTIGLNPVAEYTHFQTNGYANAWRISPEDVDNKTEYRFIVEMVTQRRFYLSTLLSFAGIVLLLILLFWTLVKHSPAKK